MLYETIISQNSTMRTGLFIERKKIRFYNLSRNIAFLLERERRLLPLDIIKICGLTKDYGKGKGIFDIDITVRKGEVYGYLGPNGAGKSTTLRHLMGFTRPQSGMASIEGMDCWRQQKKIQEKVGYLPGEIAFPDDMTGRAYLKLIGKMRRMKDFSYAEKLLDFFEIDPNAGIKRMSKGMKQKIGITAAFIHDPDVLLLDEPTSGLDPLMQNRFVELIEESKERGKTVILSSHMFEEVEKTCDRIGIIRNGKIIQETDIDDLRRSQFKTYRIGLEEDSDADVLIKAYPDAEYAKKRGEILISTVDSEVGRLISLLSKCSVRYLSEEKHTLEDYFMKFYDETDEQEKGGVL